MFRGVGLKVSLKWVETPLGSAKCKKNTAVILEYVGKWYDINVPAGIRCVKFLQIIIDGYLLH